MKTAVKAPRQDVEVRQKWRALVEELADQVESWAKERHWSVHRDTKKIRETKLGTYRVPYLSILAPEGQVQFDPVARYIVGADGRVDLMAWPSGNLMMLIRIGDSWKVETDYGKAFRGKWSQKTFERIVETLNAV